MEVRLIALMLALDKAGKAERDVLAGVQRYASEHPNWQVVVDPLACQHPGAGYAGILARSNIKFAIACADAGTPIIGLTRTSWHRGHVPRVLPNIVLAGRLAAEHLLARGFFHLGYVGLRHDLDGFFLFQGFSKRVHRGGFGLHSWHIHRNYLRRPLCSGPFDRSLAGWLERTQMPVGLLVGDDALARYVATRCVHLGLRIPDEVGLVSVGNDAALCEFPPPALTAVDLGYDRAAYRAAGLLDELIAGRPAPEYREGVEPKGVVARRSTDVDLYSHPFHQAVARWLADHCHEPLRTEDVAAAFGLGARSLRRRLGRRFEGGLAGELARARVAKACRLLRGTKMPLGDVAAASGFRTAMTLARHFRRVMGMAPTVWRRERPEE